jgi:hypothetical protein
MTTFRTDVTAIWGGRGSGKTTLARSLVRKSKVPLSVVIDPMAEDGFTTVAQVVEAMEASSTGRIIMRSARKSDQIDTILAAYLASTKARPVYCVCDEAPAYLDRCTDALSKIVFQGRHRAFGMLILGQRPNAVAAQIRSQAATTYWMRLTDHLDLSVAQQTLGPKAKTLPGFKPGQFIRHPE